MVWKLWLQALEALLLISTVTSTVVHPARTARNVNLNHHEKIIILSYDGFRFDYFNKTRTPRIDSLRANGAFTRYMKPQFMTKTFPNHQSIATGLYSESHGVMDKVVFDPKYQKVVSGYGRGDDEFWNFHENVAPAWIWNEWAGGGRVSGALWPGSDKPYGRNRTLPTYSLEYNKSRSFETRVDYGINWLTNEEKPANLVYLYFDEPDGQGHKYGPNSPEVAKAVERMDRVTGYLIDQLISKGIFQDINIILLSDHGFEEVTLDRVINITSVVDPSLYKVFGKSPVLNILPNEGKLEEIYHGLKTASATLGHFSVYRKHEIPQAWHYSMNRRVMPILLVADPGYAFDDCIIPLKKRLNITGSKFSPCVCKGAIVNSENPSSHFLICDCDSDLDPHTVFGVHGYDSLSENMRPFFISYGPAFKEGIEIMPFDNIDVFPLICQILKISPMPPNNGSLAIIHEILKPGYNYSSLSSSGRICNIPLFIQMLVILITTTATEVIISRHSCSSL